MLAISPVIEAAYVIALLVVVLTPAVITALKGHLALYVAGFLTVGVVWVIAMFRLARPNSTWASRFYGPDKLQEARTRYPDISPGDRDNSRLAVALGLGVLVVPLLAGFLSALVS